MGDGREGALEDACVLRRGFFIRDEVWVVGWEADALRGVYTCRSRMDVAEVPMPTGTSTLGTRPFPPLAAFSGDEIHELEVVPDSARMVWESERLDADVSEISTNAPVAGLCGTGDGILLVIGGEVCG